jgi:hypothetical protein
MASDDKSVSTPIASWRLVLMQDSPAPESSPFRLRGSKARDGAEAGADGEYPTYKLRLRGPGMPTGSGSNEGEAEFIGPHTHRMNVLAGIYEIGLEHNAPNDENPDLVVTLKRV